MDEQNVNKTAVTELSFKPLQKDPSEINKLIRPSVSFWQDAWYRLRKNKLGMLGIFIVLFMILFGIIAPIVMDRVFHVTYSDQTLAYAYSKPDKTDICLGRIT